MHFAVVMLSKRERLFRGKKGRKKNDSFELGGKPREASKRNRTSFRPSQAKRNWNLSPKEGVAEFLSPGSAQMFASG